MNGVIVKKIEPVYSDTRGAIADLVNEKLHHVGLINTNTGKIRGNHYHNKSIQYSYILSGKFEVLVANIDDLKKVEKMILNYGEIIIIQPKIVHSFKAIENSIMIDMTSESRASDGYESDVIKGISLHVE